MRRVLQQEHPKLIGSLQSEDCLHSYSASGTPGGILGSIWAFACSLGCGVDVDYTSIALTQETIEICDYLDYNPYTLPSAGCVLIATQERELVSKALAEHGVRVAAIGHTTSSNDRVVVRDGRRRYLGKGAICLENRS
jgi:hydrogenase maturation factor